MSGSRPNSPKASSLPMTGWCCEGDLQLDGLPGFGVVGHGEGNEGLGDRFGRRQFRLVLAGIGLGAHARRRGAGSIRFTLIALSLVSLAKVLARVSRAALVTE